MKFVKRELRRGNRYDAVILDPPSYGHGAARRSLAAGQPLAPVAGIVRPVDGPAAAVHAIDVPHAGVRRRPGSQRLMADALDSTAEHGGCYGIETQPLTIRAATGLELPSGVAVRVPSPFGRGLG